MPRGNRALATVDDVDHTDHAAEVECLRKLDTALAQTAFRVRSLTSARLVPAWIRSGPRTRVANRGELPIAVSVRSASTITVSG
jgi:hypothetical protein